MIETRGVRGTFLGTLPLAGVSGFDFYLAYPTFEGYNISQYMRSYLLTCPVNNGARATSPPFFIIFLTCPSKRPVLLDFSHFHLSPLTNIQSNTRAISNTLLPDDTAGHRKTITPYQTFSAKWTADGLESIHSLGRLSKFNLQVAHALSRDQHIGLAVRLNRTPTR